jgi:hypothetical protein
VSLSLDFAVRHHTLHLNYRTGHLVGLEIELTGIRSGYGSRFCRSGMGARTNESSAGKRIPHVFRMSCILYIEGLVICCNWDDSLRRGE